MQSLSEYGRWTRDNSEHCARRVTCNLMTVRVIRHCDRYSHLFTKSKKSIQWDGGRIILNCSIVATRICGAERLHHVSCGFVQVHFSAGALHCASKYRSCCHTWILCDPARSVFSLVPSAQRASLVIGAFTLCTPALSGTFLTGHSTYRIHYHVFRIIRARSPGFTARSNR
jgi:hypothetical protein